jgi:hypothetical protein
MSKYDVRVRSGIAFNLDDPFQKEQYEHLGKIPNVSGYLKRLIAMDMTGNWVASKEVQKLNSKEINVSVKIDENNMISFL